MQDYFIKDTNADLKAIVYTDLKRLVYVNSMYDLLSEILTHAGSDYSTEIKILLKAINS